MLAPFHPVNGATKPFLLAQW